PEHREQDGLDGEDPDVVSLGLAHGSAAEIPGTVDGDNPVLQIDAVPVETVHLTGAGKEVDQERPPSAPRDGHAVAVEQLLQLGRVEPLLYRPVPSVRAAHAGGWVAFADADLRVLRLGQVGAELGH